MIVPHMSAFEGQRSAGNCHRRPPDVLKSLGDILSNPSSFSPSRRSHHHHLILVFHLRLLPSPFSPCTNLPPCLVPRNLPRQSFLLPSRSRTSGFQSR